MSRMKFHAGMRVDYYAKVAPAIHMSDVRVIGLNGRSENLWKRKDCSVSKGWAPRRVEKGEGRMEDQYIIEHWHGWKPGDQVGKVNPEIKLSAHRRYYFAYESELSKVD